MDVYHKHLNKHIFTIFRSLSICPVAFITPHYCNKAVNEAATNLSCHFRVEILDDLLISFHGGNIDHRPVFVVERPEVDAKVDEEGDAVHVVVDGGEVKRRVAPHVGLVRVAPK